MIRADNFTCDVPENVTTTIECNMPDPGVLEWMTGLGTAGATLAAVAFGIVEIVRSRKERARLKAQHDRQLLNSQFQKVAGIMSEMAEAFPLNTNSQSNRFHAQVKIYEDLLGASQDAPLMIKQKAGSLFTRFGAIALHNNAENSAKTSALQNANKKMGVNSQILPKVVLQMLSARLEAALSAWHASGIGGESAAAEVEELDAEMEEHEKRIDEYGLIWRSEP